MRKWARKHRLALIKSGKYIGIGLIVVVALQLLYPSSRALPGVKIADMSVGGASTASIQKRLDDAYKSAKLVVKTTDKTVSTTYDEAGVSIASKNTAQASTKYGWGERLVPFSSVAIMLKRNTPTQTSYDDDRLAYFAQQTSKKTYVAPVNASVAIKGSTVVLVSSKPSKSYDQSVIVAAIKHANHQPLTTVEVSPAIKPAPRTDNQVKGVLKQAQKAVDTSLTLTFDDERKPVTKSEIASWLDFTEDTSKQLTLTLKNDAVQKYLDSIQGKVYKAPGTTTVQLVDNLEVSRTVGAAGRGIDAPKTVSLITDALHEGKEATIGVPIATLQPVIIYNRSYSKTSAGLQALLATIAGNKGFGVSVIDPGRGITGGVNAGKQFEAASTYKLFVAYAIFQQINSGAMQWTDTINGKPADQCFEAMIVKSDNPCALAFGNKIGWGTIDNMIHGIGFNSTTLSGSTKYTTAGDLAAYLQRLQAGTLLNGADQGRLVDAMKRQIYRAGIPAGTGLPVADKVGFVDNVIHDAGIVYGPNGPYIMVVMTSNSSWGAIADIARQINTFMN